MEGLTSRGLEADASDYRKETGQEFLVRNDPTIQAIRRSARRVSMADLRQQLRSEGTVSLVEQEDDAAREDVDGDLVVLKPLTVKSDG